jgi:RNase P subunit RPR2
MMRRVYCTKCKKLIKGAGVKPEFEKELKKMGVYHWSCFPSNLK